MLAKLQNMSEVWQKRLFVVMTAAAIAPLYFENAAQIGGVLFLLPLILLTIVSWSKKNVSLNAFEKGWVRVAMIYALVFVLSFLLRPPYTDDGTWRLSSPGFVLLLLVWFWVSVKLELGEHLMKLVAFSSIIFAVALFLAELYVSGGWYKGYRYGEVLADLGKTGFFLPLTTFLFGLLFLRNWKVHYFVLFLLAFILSGLVAGRTSLVMIALPLVVIVVYLLLHTKYLSTLHKISIFIVSLVILGGGIYISKGKLEEAVHDYQLAEQNNYYSSLGLRAAMFKIGAEIVEKNFVFGVGPNAYKSKLKEYVGSTHYSRQVKKIIPTFTHLHNQFLMDFVLSGIAGFFSLVLFIGYPIILFWSLYRCGDKEEAVFGLSFMVGFWFILFFGAIFTYTYTTIFYMLTVSSVVMTFRYLNGWKKDS